MEQDEDAEQEKVVVKMRACRVLTSSRNLFSYHHVTAAHHMSYYRILSESQSQANYPLDQLACIVLYLSRLV